MSRNGKNRFGSNEMEAKLYEFDENLYWAVINGEVTPEAAIALMRDMSAKVPTE